MKLRCALVALAILSGCPDTSEEAIVRVAADRTLSELGLIEYVLAAFEEQNKIRTRLVYDDTDGLQKRALAGEFDYVFVVSETTLDALQKQSIPIRVETYAHEEFVMIGPWENMLGRYTGGDAAKMMQNVARSTYRFLKGKKGSVEHARYLSLIEATGDRDLSGSIFATEEEGVALVKHAVDSRSFALVKRSSLLQAAAQGHVPHRIYREADPGLVLRMILVEVHPGKTRAKRKPELFDWLLGDKGKSLVENFGERQFGYPVFGVGEPEEGKGAAVPKLEQKEGLQRPEEEEAKPE
jgi:ABC-type tungstate transport system permease subunit